MMARSMVAARPGTDVHGPTAMPRPDGGARLASLAAPAPVADPVQVFEATRRAGWNAMLWHLPHRQEALVGIGALATLTGAGPGRFARVAGEWRAMTATALRFPGAQHRGAPARGPLLMGGFAFAPGDGGGPWQAFGDARLWVPRWVYQVAGRQAWLHAQIQVPADHTAAAARRLAEAALAAVPAVLEEQGPPAGPVEPAGAGRLVQRRDVPPKTQWLAAVEEAVAAIRAGEMEKAVLARAVQVTVPGGFAPGPALRYLRAHYPDCYVFAVAQGGQCFLGATPERLVRLQDGQVDVACLAGSIGRGQSAAEDQRLGEALLASAKNRHEHQVVLDAIRAALAPLCTDLEAPAAPALLKFANVQHLYTPVRARAATGVTVLELAARVHPTPAIGGHPTDKALALIRRLEAAPRGWYAGPIGWVDSQGQGELAVALRSGLLDGEDAWLYAGCGIMADSDPESEYAESCLKLRPMLAALGAEGP